MSLTKHLYDREEVLAALAWCGSRGVVAETVFWCRELVISGFAAEAIRVLFESWLWHRAPYHPEWLIDAMRVLGGEEVTEEGILERAAALSQCAVRDHSLGWVWQTPLEGLWERVTPAGPRWLGGEDALVVYFHRAVHQRRGGAAWWAACHMRDVWQELRRWLSLEVIEALQGYEGLWGAQTAEMDRCVLAAGVLMACARVPLVSLVSAPVTWVSDWDRLTGRAARVYPIPCRALYGVRVKDTSRGLFHAARLCPEDEWPDDLPDEWDRAEKEKSHGPSEGPAKASVWMRRHLGGWSRLMWRAQQPLWRAQQPLWQAQQPLWQAKRAELQRSGRAERAEPLERELVGEPYTALLGACLCVKSVECVQVDPARLVPVHKRPKIAQAMRAPL
jgi:hypothetical protein